MKRVFCYFNIVMLVFALAYTKNLSSQNSSISGIKYIQKLIENDSLQKAKAELNYQIDYFKTLKNNDTLVDYIPLIGSFKLANGDSKIAIQNAETFVDELKQLHNSKITIDAIIELSNIYFNARLYNKVHDVSFEALKIIKNSQNIDASKQSIIEYNLGTALLSLGRIKKGKEHLYKSKKILEEHPKIELLQFYNTYNSIGRAQSSLTQIDSSTFYYKKAIEILDKMDRSEVNRDYWRAIVNNNISLNFQNTGKTDQAITYITNSIYDFQKFINVAKNESKKLRAKRFRLSTIDNLATFYDGLGEFNRALDLLEYSYHEKLKFLKEDDPNVIFSLVIQGHVNLNAKNYRKAADYTDKALKYINQNPSNYSFLHSFTLTIRASIYEAMNEMEGAKRLYQESEALYNKNFDGTYSRDYLDALIEMSKFYAKKNESKKAIDLALKGYQFTKNESFENQLTKFNQKLNLAQVYLLLKKYHEALTYSNEALNLFKNNKLKAKTLSDSIQIEFRKPKTLLINTKAQYYLKENKDESFLKSLLSQLKEGVKILEQRKVLIKTPQDLNVLIQENNDLFDFIKQLRLNLYEITKNKNYLNDLIAIHESSIYNRIRSRLNVKNNISFANIPLKITKREKLLKNNLSTSLNTSNKSIEPFFKAESNWNTFLDSLKLNYPKYYKMRYATIEESLDHLQNNIPNNTTVVRYLFIEDNLYAFVASKTQKNLFKLNFKEVKEFIHQLTGNQSDIDVVSPKLLQLYQELWQPFDNQIKTEHVIIFPDGELFNLSFETLTPTKINTFKELASNSLLAKYFISYNYSLLLLDDNRKTVDYSNDFIAFAPEFNDKMKDDYKIAITDSLSLDKTYLTLLPQPFSVELAKQYSKLFKGESFLNEKASKTIFEQETNEHKIIQIGTHAESNNVSPELSRLIFAKNESNEDNSLYTYEIYNQNLNSNLAILTACETGKPTYQSGEGMISLAHAFNYAGSESILTSLWKIDEQSSTQIISSFYKNLSKGLSKDNALQQAKLEYIASAKGRTISPKYWAGLVLIGDASPINIHASSTNLLFWFFAVLAIILIAVFIRKKTSSK